MVLKVLNGKWHTKRPLLTIRLAAVTMSFFGITTLFCFFAPLLLISFTTADFGLYFKAVGEAFNIFSTPLVIYLSLLTVVMSCIFIISGIFILFRKSWARTLIVYSLVIVIPLFIINTIVVSLVRGHYSPNYRGIFFWVFHVCLLHLFTRVQIKQLFTEQTAKQKID